MDQYLLSVLSKKLRIAPLSIIRENMEMEILAALAQSEITNKMVFYGGTALRLAYGSPRYSEDLDFLMTKMIRPKELAADLKKIVQKKPEIFLTDLKNKRNTLFAVLNIKSSFLKHPINIKIEIAKRKNGLRYEYIPLSSSCSHLKPIMATATLESLEKLKQKTLLQRDEPRDWFDLWYISKCLKKQFEPSKKFPFDKKEFRRELKRFLPQDKWILIDQI